MSTAQSSAVASSQSFVDVESMNFEQTFEEPFELPPLSTTPPSYTSSSPDLHPVDLEDVIPEEDEEDVTSGEDVEPLTPTNDSHSPSFHHRTGEPFPTMSTTVVKSPVKRPPPTRTMASPEKVATAPRDIPGVRTSKTAPSPTGHSFRKHASQSLKSLFRRTSSHSSHDVNAPPVFNLPTGFEGSVEDSTFLPTPRPQPSRRMSLKAITSGILSSAINAERRSSVISKSANHSPECASSKTSSPTSSSANSTYDPSWEDQELMNRHHRSATGLSIPGRRLREGIVFGPEPKPTRPMRNKKRTASLSGLKAFAESDELKEHISAHAPVGVGLKSRRMSLSLPDDFVVNSVELMDEFSSSSLLPGRRGKTIGKGATAKVKVMYRKGESRDVLYAVKEFRKKGIHEDQEEYEKKVKSEFTIANSLHHPNIVQTVRLCTHNGRWNHVMEFCPVGELYSLVSKGYLKREDKLCFFKQLLQGIAYLHAHGIAHRDIKPENLLLSAEGHVKITDFGVSEVFSGEHPGLRSAGGQCGKNMGEVRLSAPGICGSLPYIAPEVIAKKGKYDPRPLDVWSCAIVLLTMWYGGNPWNQADEFKDPRYKTYVGGWREWISKHPEFKGQIPTHNEVGIELPKVGPCFAARSIDSVPLRRLMLQMLHPDPAKRISIQEAVTDRWVKTIECCCLENEGDVKCIDASGKASCKRSTKMTVKKLHNHLPPPPKKGPQYSFDLGGGYS